MMNPTCMMSGNMSSRLMGPAMLSGRDVCVSNQNTGNIRSVRFLNMYSIPATLRMKTFSCSLMLTFTGMEDVGSTHIMLS